MVNEPYLSWSELDVFVFVTVSQYVQLENDMSAVVAIDINMGTPYFRDMISKNLAEDGQADETYEAYFLATKG